MKERKQEGVPNYRVEEYREKRSDYCVLIPVINEGERILKELFRAAAHQVSKYADIVLCDGGSDDGSMESKVLQRFNVNTLLTKEDSGKQGAQLRMGISWALDRGYQGIITVDGNNKDSIEDVPQFIEKLEQGYDYVQGSRFIRGGRAVRTPFLRLLAVRLIHAPVVSLTAKTRFTDTTNAFRGYSRAYLTDGRVEPLRDLFIGYELLAYLSVRASQIGMRTCEIPVRRIYPDRGKVPTKISGVKGNGTLFLILIRNLFGCYAPKRL